MSLQLMCCLAAVLLGPRDTVVSQAVGGYTNPYGGAQPWSNEPVPHYVGLGATYAVTRFTSVRLTGLPVDDHATGAMGLYTPLDRDGDGVVDLLDGRPVYVQRDVRTVQPTTNDVETGVRVGRYYLYYRYALGGWAVHPSVGSAAQAMLFCPADHGSAHELHGLRAWQRVDGEGFVPDRRLQLLDLAHAAYPSGAAAGVDVHGHALLPAGGARMDLAALGEGALEGLKAQAFLETEVAAGGALCPQGHFRDERTTLCLKCPRGRYGDSNTLASAWMCTECPAGKFLPHPGGKTELECQNCTEGRYASYEGAEECGGACPLGKFSVVSGAVDNSACSKCPPGYRSAQCDRKDNSKQARRQRERDKRLKIQRSRQDAGRNQAASSCTT